MRRQPEARIFMTEATAEIGDALLHNSVNVMTRQREEIGARFIRSSPTRKQIARRIAGSHCPLGQPFTLDGERATAATLTAS